MLGFWAGGEYEYLMAIERRYQARRRALRRRLKRAETLDRRDAVLVRMRKLDSEFREQTRNVGHCLF